MEKIDPLAGGILRRWWQARKRRRREAVGREVIAAIRAYERRAGRR